MNAIKSRDERAFIDRVRLTRSVCEVLVLVTAACAANEGSNFIDGHKMSVVIVWLTRDTVLFQSHYGML